MGDGARLKLEHANEPVGQLDILEAMGPVLNGQGPRVGNCGNLSTHFSTSGAKASATSSQSTSEREAISN